MDEERLRIQKMVADGKITPEEGAELVESLRTQGPVGDSPLVSGRNDQATNSRRTHTRMGIISLVLFLASPVLFFVFVAINVVINRMVAFQTVAQAGGAATPADIAFTFNKVVYAGLVLLGCEMSAAVLGFDSWRSISGKIGAIGGLVMTFLMLLVALFLLFASS